MAQGLIANDSETAESVGDLVHWLNRALARLPIQSGGSSESSNEPPRYEHLQ